ncbi:MAG TPA: SDR family oxidoreductase [Candidatus Binatia bacterium]|jgi:NAD(P)-dependent dehydrogenase (short-subunit alcohol dehydrogenase family)|nr:SDR family oxidoreductase [Candidatus Binatia bacterium]
MNTFRGKLAVVTGGGTGMGRELTTQLAADGCSVAICDVSPENMAETKRLADAIVIGGARITTHVCDVSDERQVLAFRDAVLAEHATQHINLLFNNAGIGGGGSFVNGERAEWERTFNVCWFGVYYCTRAFLPLLVASDEGCIINTSSVNGFWASLGPSVSHTAYSSAKFAVKGFTEALITDLRLNAPHVKAVLVMPGHIGTSIMFNSAKVLGKADALSASTEDVAEVRTVLARRGLPEELMTDDQIRAGMHQMAVAFRDNAPTTAAQAATTILDGVRTDTWRVLVGSDAQALDQLVREQPERAYESSFAKALNDQGHMRLLE